MSSLHFFNGISQKYVEYFETLSQKQLEYFNKT